MLLEQFGFHGDSFLLTTLHAYEEVDSENDRGGLQQAWTRALGHMLWTIVNVFHIQ